MSDKDHDGLFTDRDSFNPQVNAIPLSDVDTHGKGQGSIGRLVKDASAQVSTLIRSEIELAKTEVAGAAKKAGIAVGLFGAAGVILAYSSFFLFFTIAEVLDTWMPRWLAFLIVFLVMIVLVAVLAVIGISQLTGVKKPEKTLDSLSRLPEVVPSKDGSASAHPTSGLYT